MNAPHPRLSINQATIRRTTVAEALAAVGNAHIGAIGLWREQVHETGLRESAARLADSGLRSSTLCRGGWFTAAEGRERRAAIDDNRRAIDETAVLTAAGAPGSRAVLVLVVGGLPDDSRDLASTRARVRDAVGELVPHAESLGVTLALEPLHPMYAADRSVLSTLPQALDLAADFAPAVVGVAVDTFHLWWDPDVLAHIARAGAEGRIASYQVCDWKTPLAADVLLSRHYPGDGVIDFGPMTRAVEAAGYDGDIEVELLSQAIWDTPAGTAIERARAGFSRVVAPHLREADDSL